MYFIDLDTQTFFNDEETPIALIPPLALAISDEQFAQFKEAANEHRRVLPDLTLSEPPPSAQHVWHDERWRLKSEVDAENLQTAKTLALNKLNDSAQAYINRKAGLHATPDFEVRTWTLQSQEAKAWAVDNNAPTPILDTIAQNRGVPSAILKQKALEKAQAFEVLTATVAGIRQAAEDRILALDNVDEVNAFSVSFGE